MDTSLSNAKRREEPGNKVKKSAEEDRCEKEKNDNLLILNKLTPSRERKTMRSMTEGKKEEAVFLPWKEKNKRGGGRPAKWGSNWYMKGSRWLGCSPNRKVSEGRKGVSRTALGG